MHLLCAMQTSLACIYILTLLADATVEFESLYYSVDEGSSVEVCAVVTDPDLPCAIDFEFDFKVEVNASSAGIYTHKSALFVSELSTFVYYRLFRL